MEFFIVPGLVALAGIVAFCSYQFCDMIAVVVFGIRQEDGE